MIAIVIHTSKSNNRTYGSQDSFQEDFFGNIVIEKIACKPKDVNVAGHRKEIHSQYQASAEGKSESLSAQEINGSGHDEPLSPW